MRRRELITLLGGAALAWPLTARAQQVGIPVVGYLHAGTPGESELVAFRKGLSETEARDVAIEYRFASNDYHRLPDLAADLARRRVSVIAAQGGRAALAAKAATTTIPIVFYTGTDPVLTGLVARVNRPGGNVTGLSSIGSELIGKQLGLLHALLPKAAHFAVLINPNLPWVNSTIKDAQAAAAAIGRQVGVLTASTNREIDAAFESLARIRADGLLVSPALVFDNHRSQLTMLAAYHRVPAIYFNRDFVKAGGLMSYGTSWPDQFGLVGVYVGRILRGEKPADLPVMRPLKFELVINMKAAKVLGLTVPPGLLAIVDEVIE
jgi:putative tryptophan/tyrosine transport system substrate-binding protein